MADAQVCAQHPAVAAAYRCDGCNRLLCGQCIKEGHALLFCAVCGDRALPLSASQPATARELRRHQAVSRPYSFREALLYPFRGLGLYLYFAALVSMLFIDFLLRFGFGRWPIVFAFGFWSLMVGLQFKIVRSTAEGDDELPDWPDYADFGERLRDILTYLVVLALQVGPVVLYVVLGAKNLLDPNLGFWAGFAVVAWLGVALSLMAYGAAGRFDRLDALRIDRHVRGFLIGGADAVTATNLAFGLGILFFLLRATLEQLPWVGSIVGNVVGAYWLFTSAHLTGVLFRRHIFQLEQVYR